MLEECLNRPVSICEIRLKRRSNLTFAIFQGRIRGMLDDGNFSFNIMKILQIHKVFLRYYKCEYEKSNNVNSLG